MSTFAIRSNSLDRTACRLVLAYGSDAAIVAYTKAVACEVEERMTEARSWRGVLGRVVAIDNALQTAGVHGAQIASLH